MAKKETQPQIEAKAETQNRLNDYQKAYVGIAGEIVHLTEEIKYQIQWLEQHCQMALEKYESEWDLRLLMELKNKLENTRNELRLQNYCLSYGSDYTKYFYGEISEEEFMRTLEY
jgi:hypothetical protein